MNDKVYRPKDLLSLKPIIKKAASMWAKECQAYYDRHGDQGSCVSGAGIKIRFIPKRARLPRPMFIIQAYEVSPAQGSLVWEDSVDKILKFLKKHGIEAYYCAGRMN